MKTGEDEIQQVVDRETRAWDTQDAELLVSIFHPDMVWPWPRDAHAHNPTDWVFPLGRYDRERWKAGWQELFDTHTLVHNRRNIVRSSSLSRETGRLRWSMSTRFGDIARRDGTFTG